jgi:hypothetical protein
MTLNRDEELAELRQELKLFKAKEHCLPEGFDIGDDCSAHLAIRLVEAEAQLAQAQQELVVARKSCSFCGQSQGHAETCWTVEVSAQLAQAQAALRKLSKMAKQGLTETYQRRILEQMIAEAERALGGEKA